MKAESINNNFHQQTWFIVIMLIVFAPLGLYLALSRTNCPKRIKIIATALTAVIFFFIFVTTTVNQKPVSKPHSVKSSQTPEEVIPKPDITITGAQYVNNTLTLTRQTPDASFIIQTGKLADKTATKLTVNGNEITANNAFNSYFSYSTTLEPGDNKFDIIASNKAGKDQKTLVIKYEPIVKSSAPKPTPPTAPTDDTIFEAEVTCQEYAEKQLAVKNININYDQSSIKKKNSDGTIIIKVNIADSQGFLKPEKPLGTMECTTDSTGMKILNFLHY